jgi:hypothetical protein
MDFLALFALGSVSQVLVHSNVRMHNRGNGLDTVLAGALAAKEHGTAKV